MRDDTRYPKQLAKKELADPASELLNGLSCAFVTLAYFFDVWFIPMYALESRWFGSWTTFVVVLFSMVCLPVEQVASQTEDPSYARALQLAKNDQFDEAIRELENVLAASSDNCQRALLDEAFQQLRDDERFRRAMHEASIQHRLATLTLAPPNEPGEWIEVEVRVVDANRDPVPGAVVRVFATDNEGRYHPTLDGERLPRLFGSLVSDEDGRCVFRTVRPGPYPGTRNARHVHISAWAGSLRLAVPHYAVFDDDPLLNEPQNAEQRGEAVRIEMESVDGQARGTLVLPMR